MTSERDEIVHLVTAANPADAHIWAQALLEDGVFCRVVGDYMDTAWMTGRPAGAEIWVHKEDVQRASRVLQRIGAIPVEPAAGN